MKLNVIQADYNDQDHRTAILYLLNDYACDPMGGGTPLSQFVKNNLINELAKLPHAFSVLAFSGLMENIQPVGLINCFTAFSTFSCKPLVNIHDVAVIKSYRGLGISQKMLQKVEEIALKRGCCKLTLEVLSKNNIAQSAYQTFGFTQYQLDPKAGNALFLEKKLS